MQAAKIEINYGGTSMEVFHQIRVGRLRLYNAAARDMLGVVQETWKRGTLGKTFLVRPFASQIVGEEVVDSTGRVIAVFGLAITNAFLPDPKPQREYREKLQTLLNQL
jgi:hypothetical protein